MSDQTRDPIAEIFDRAVKDGRHESVWQYWSSLPLLHALITDVSSSRFLGNGEKPGIADMVEAAMSQIAENPSCADLKPREYERLVVSLERLRDAIDEFDKAYRPVQDNMYHRDGPPR